MIPETSAKMAEETPEKDEPAAGAETGNEFAGELSEPRWAVMSFDSVAATGVTYEDARRRMEELQKQNIPGLCVVTREAAGRFAN